MRFDEITLCISKNMCHQQNPIKVGRMSQFEAYQPCT